jgi:large repetitive protein
MGLLRPARVIAFLAFSVGFLHAALGQAFTPIRVNAGGSAYTDGATNVWSADTGYNTGSTASSGSAIAGTTDDTLFQTNRWDSAGGSELEYSFSVPNGLYKVRLLFAETWSGAYSVNARVFDVEVEGSLVLPDVDVYAQAGANAALALETTAYVGDGQINVRFIHGVENPFVSALEITSAVDPSVPLSFVAEPFSESQVSLSWAPSVDDVGVTGYQVERCQGSSCTNFAMVAAPSGTSYDDSGLSAATTYRYRVRAVDTSGNFSAYSVVLAAVPNADPKPVIRVNAGGSTYADTSGNVWSADTGFNTGNVAGTGAAIGGTTDDTLYQSQRWDSAGGAELEYVFTLTPDAYQVYLHFAETWFGSSGARIFHVQLEGVTALSNIDVVAEVGANTALVKTATTTVSDGQLNIRFLHATDNPIVNAIAVLRAPPADGTPPSAPAGLSAVPISGGMVALSWSASTDNVAVAGYDIERCTGASCTSFAKVATATGTTQNDTTVAGNETYRYRVRAYDATGNRSAYSSVDDATTPNASAQYVYDELGRIVLFTTASGASIVYAYDESGNVTAIVRAAP